MTYTFHFYKERSGRWFFDDESKDIYREEMIAGVPEILNLYADKNFFVDVEITDTLPENLNEYEELIFSKEETSKYTFGVVYTFKGQAAWLCPTFWKYFDEPAPERIYFKLL